MQLYKLKHSLTTRLLLGFAAMLLIFSLAAWFNFNQVREVQDQIAVQNDKTALKQQAMELKILVQEMKDLSSGYMISQDDQYIQAFNEKKPRLQSLINSVGAAVSTNEQRKARGNLVLSSGAFVEAFDRAVSVVGNRSLKESDIKQNISLIYSESEQLRDEIFSLADRFIADFSADQARASAISQSRMDRTVTAMMIAPPLVLVLGLAISLSLTRSFIVPIRKLENAVAGISEGDLRLKINAVARDELGRLSTGFDRMVDRVRGMIDESRTIASSLSEHSESFKRYSRDTAELNEEMTRAIREVSQAANTEAARADRSAQLLVTLKDEIGEIRESTESMRRTNTEAEHRVAACSNSMSLLKEASARSEALIGKAVEAMRALATSSEQIREITAAISAVSQQTHILSLNAAIEAASAGVYGKGFSVIAEEVRKLSQQTANSAKRIAGLVTGLHDQAGSTLDDLLVTRDGFQSQTECVADAMQTFSDIMASMQDISAEINQVHERIEDVNEKSAILAESFSEAAASAQETAAGAEQISAASERQNEAVARIATQASGIHLLADKLFGEISLFRTL